MEAFLLNLVKNLVVSKAQSLVAEQVEEQIGEENMSVLNTIVDKMEDNEFKDVAGFLRG